MRPVRSAASHRVCQSCIRALHSTAQKTTGTSPRPLPLGAAQVTRKEAPAAAWPVVRVSKRFISHGAWRGAPSAPSAASESSSRSDSSRTPETFYDFFPSTLPDGPPPRGHFPIDVRALRREFLQLQARAHPDLHPPEQKTRALATSATINEAFKTLSNPLLRAQYLLSLQGVDVAENETAKVEDPELLMTVLEAREDIEASQKEGELDHIRKINDERIQRSEDILEGAFRDHDLDMAKAEAIRLRYWVNIKESLDNWEAGKEVVLQH